MNIFFGELLGTLLMILLGNGVVANVLLTQSKGFGGGWIVISAGWGFAVGVAVYVAGWVSGAHLNPSGYNAYFRFSCLCDRTIYRGNARPDPRLAGLFATLGGDGK